MRDLVRIYASIILFLQAFGCLGWWILMATVPSVREAFSFPGMPSTVFNGLFLPDALLYAGLAAVGAVMLSRDSSWAFPFLAAHAGASAYATLMAVGLASASGGGMIGAIAMAVPTAIEGFLALMLWKETRGAAR